MNRRHFLTAAGAAAGMAFAQPGAKKLPIRKGVYWSMLPDSLSVEERFTLARDCGFESIELPTEDDPKMAERLKAASQKAGVPIHSVMNQAHWKFPFSSPDPAVVAQGRKGMETSLRNAQFWGAETVLLVPAVVTPQVSYRLAWDRSASELRRLLPLATELKVTIAIEEVWNKFLLSPLEMATYIDSFNSPYVRAYYDVGNMVLYGFPQDWIRTLGPRIAKLHFKDFTFRRDPNLKKTVADWVNLRDGDIDWKAVHAALAEVGFKGDATVELSGGDAAYLKDVAKRVDLILEGA